jgi:Immunity protein 35
MITKAEAIEIVKRYLQIQQTAMKRWIRADSRHGCPELVLLEEKMLELDFGWGFFYQSRAYLESRDFRDALLGNAPLIVDKSDGSLYVTGTAHPFDYYVEQHRRRRLKRYDWGE